MTLKGRQPPRSLAICTTLNTEEEKQSEKVKVQCPPERLSRARAIRWEKRLDAYKEEITKKPVRKKKELTMDHSGFHWQRRKSQRSLRSETQRFAGTGKAKKQSPP